MKPYIFLLALLWQGILLGQLAPSFDSLTLVHSDTILFSSGKHDLTVIAEQQIANFPEATNGSDRLYLTGHTDDVGPHDQNEALAERRAQTVANSLTDKGWNSENVLLQTFGERTPIAENQQAAGRQRNRRVTLDHYQAVPYLRVNGQAVDPTSGEGIDQAMVRVHGRTISDTIITDQEGRFDLHLPVDSIVGIDVYARDYFLSTRIIRVKARMKKDIKIEIQRAEVGAVADIANFFFYGSKAILLPRSEPELPKLKTFLEVNPHLVVEIAGHVNIPNAPPIPTTSTSWDLSIRRAKMVYDYLTTNGIPEAQLSYQGYGNHEMRFPKANKEREYEANRRVEIRIVGKQ